MKKRSYTKGVPSLTLDAFAEECLDAVLKRYRRTEASKNTSKETSATPWGRRVKVSKAKVDAALRGEYSS